ncbi:MAG: GIY-YIG nuclease family protein [Candidatus Marinimicrobia bacterium]|nr:GIY-YIG nuclease family protein [Candidatus Neomarinimicrobiota bacterium]MCF7828178.1 GIY-YIG nuclease family protein [Candidatus Neomarinimicrobiota bacterium]MCF7879647.1 GIY-YIG nuclease family protein [Candidatus Neomarinimicrobiota bacterium]
MQKVSGGYILKLTVSKETEIQVGKLGLMELTPGEYLYGGSAKKGIVSRINRHMEPEKKRYWHIDYLTTHPGVDIEEVWCFPGQSEIEHQLADHSQAGIDSILRGFGNSDCAQGCPAHLWKVTGEISPEDLSEDYYIVTHAQTYATS